MSGLHTLCVLLAASFVTDNAAGNQQTPKEGLEELLPEWKSAWNAVDTDRLFKLYHPDSRIRKLLEDNPAKRKAFDDGMSEAVAEFGKIKSYTIGKYIERKDRYVVKAVYTKKGNLPGTFAVKKVDDGTYRVFDFNIDGQGEPELTQ
ncbi:MAG TPA: hypothetical protein VMY42_02365 [Thermoguttaceae bacterium]|nr:hypothetical protein [Thermoguttaceae bacterium]